MPNGRTSIRSNLAVTVAGQLSRFAIQMISIAVLSRLLDPSVFGLMAMVLAIVGVANVLGDFGLSLAAIRRANLSQSQANGMFWVNTLIGLIVAIAVILVGPLISQFYGVDLQQVCLGLSLVFLLNGIAVQFRVALIRAERFHALALAEVFAQLLGLVSALIIAAMGVGLAALIAQQTVIAAVSLVSFAMLSGWRPQAPSVRIGIKGVFGFSASATGAQLLNYVSSNTPAIALGRALDATQVGSFSRAFQIVNLPLQQLAGPLTRVLLPALGNNLGTTGYDKLLLRAHATLSYSVAAVAVICATASHEIVQIMLGSGWSGTESTLSILAIGCLFQALGYCYYWVSLAEARMTILLVCEVPGRLLAIVASIILAPSGLAWVSIGLSASSFAIWIASSVGVLYSSTAKGRPLLTLSLRVIIIAVLTATLVLASEHVLQGVGNEFMRLGAIIALVLVAGASTLAVPSYRRDLALIVRGA